MASRKGPRVRVTLRAHGYVMYAYIAGKTYQRSAQTRDEGIAHRKARAWEREIRDGLWDPELGTTGAMTVKSYAHMWLERREGEGVRSVGAERRHLDKHVIPYLGERRLQDLRGAHVRDWVLRLRRQGAIKSKSIKNVHGTLRAMLSDARFREIIPSNPAADLPRGTLPKIKQGEGRARAASAYTREEVETLVSDRRIPADRRVLYALMFLTGMRFGEAVGRRWRDYDAAVEPLGSLRVESQHNDRPLKNDNPRVVPVHPVLAEMLEEWRRDGFARLFGRHPRPEDWIVPARGRGYKGSGVRPEPTAYLNLRKDCEATGEGFRRMHDTRHTFVSQARIGGASSYWIGKITHNGGGKGDEGPRILDAYTHPDWRVLCDTVQCVRVVRRRPADVRPLRPEADGPSIAPTIAEIRGGADGPENGGSKKEHEGAPALPETPPNVQDARAKRAVSGREGGRTRIEGAAQKPGDPGGPALSIAGAIEPARAAAILREIADEQADPERAAVLYALEETLKSG